MTSMTSATATPGRRTGIGRHVDLGSATFRYPLDCALTVDGERAVVGAPQVTGCAQAPTDAVPTGSAMSWWCPETAAW